MTGTKSGIIRAAGAFGLSFRGLPLQNVQPLETTSGSRRVLVVEDEPALRDRMSDILRFEGFEVEIAASVADGIRKVLSDSPDIILCDILMPKGDGVDLVSFVRSRADTRLLPIVMVTALADRQWQRRFMELGADDYLTKPFKAAELVGAVQTQCTKLEWREGSQVAKGGPGQCYAFAGRVFDPVRRMVRLPDGEEQMLTASEAQLLTILLDSPGQAQSRESIMNLMGRDFTPLDRLVDVLIGRLRRRVGDAPRKPTLILTIRRSGYLLDTAVELQNVDPL